VWCQQCVAVRAGGCLWWIPTQKDAKTQLLAPWHPTAAATNNLMTVLYFSSEMSGLWPGPRSQKNVEKLAAAPGYHTPLLATGHCQLPATASDHCPLDTGLLDTTTYRVPQQPQPQTTHNALTCAARRRRRHAPRKRRQLPWRWRATATGDDDEHGEPPAASHQAAAHSTLHCLGACA
jgi:hypothetical protein